VGGPQVAFGFAPSGLLGADPPVSIRCDGPAMSRDLAARPTLGPAVPMASRQIDTSPNDP
jgi:hypothetical protein